LPDDGDGFGRAFGASPGETNVWATAPDATKAANIVEVSPTTIRRGKERDEFIRNNLPSVKVSIRAPVKGATRQPQTRNRLAYSAPARPKADPCGERLALFVG
jgi:hypothetical protein